MYLSWRIVEMTPRERHDRLAGEEFDKKYGVDTARDRFSEWAADIDSPNWAEGTGYDATPPHGIRDPIQALPIEHENFTFIDLGCGKGRVVLVASEFAFEECIGVEYAPDLCDVAEKNISIFHSDTQQCHNIKAVCADAATFSLPELPLVLFFAHPFGNSVLEQFLGNLHRSLKATPRKIYVIYYDPICGDLFEKAGFREVEGRGLQVRRVVPDFLLNPLGWFAVTGFANRRAMEYLIYEN